MNVKLINPIKYWFYYELHMCCVYVFVLGPVTHYLQRTVFPVLLPGLEALLTEARKHGCFEVYISTDEDLFKKQKLQAHYTVMFS